MRISCLFIHISRVLIIATFQPKQSGKAALEKVTISNTMSQNPAAIHRNLGEEDKAKQHFKECLKIIPDHKKAKENLAKLLDKL